MVLKLLVAASLPLVAYSPDAAVETPQEVYRAHNLTPSLIHLADYLHGPTQVFQGVLSLVLHALQELTPTASLVLTTFLLVPPAPSCYKQMAFLDSGK